MVNSHWINIMILFFFRLNLFLFSGLLFILVCFPFSGKAADQDSIKRGKYILQATGGCSCHTDPANPDQKFAGNRPLKTPYGPIYSSNITSDQQTGIGRWTLDDFVQSMTKGERPNGDHLFPVFPYTNFTGMKKSDLTDLFHYLQTIPAIKKEIKSNEMIPPFGWRFGLFFWKLVFFKSETFIEQTDKTTEWNRGAYLVESMAHCSECHTPRNLAGALKKDMKFAGSVEGAEGQLAPNITPDVNTGIGSWQKADLDWFLQTGQKPDGDSTEGIMNEVIVEGYQNLTDSDLNAISEYMLSQKAIKNKLSP
jgi:mono/diheme cytochrome c family protein